MDTQTLTEALRNLQLGEMTWSFALYSAQKSRDGLELDWNICKMKNIAGQVETIKTNLLEKTTAEKVVAEYSPFLSYKENHAAIERTDDLVKDQITDILLNIQNGLTYAPEDFVSGILPKITGYGFYGEIKDAEGHMIQALFIKRGNPFLAGEKVNLCTTSGDEIVTSENPILKFTAAVDFIYIGGICYFNSAPIERDFDIENRNFVIASKRMDKIAEAEIVSDYEQLEKAVMSSKNAKKFIDFDNEILERVKKLSIMDRQDFLLTYGINIDDRNGCIDTSDPEQCELVIDFLCGRICIDPHGRLATGSNITPRE